MKVKTLIILFIIPLITYSQEFQLKSGDLIFQESCSDDIGNAIKDVTNSVGENQFTHVGIVYIDNNDSVFVLEATIPIVSLTPLFQYLYPENKKCHPKSVVARLKPQFQSLIPEALEFGMTLIGQEYDYGYVLNNDKYYCSELVYEILKYANDGNIVFPLNIMTFKSSNTGETIDSWLKYFQERDLSIPEGELGINPGAMSLSEVIDIVHYY